MGGIRLTDIASRAGSVQLLEDVVRALSARLGGPPVIGHRAGEALWQGSRVRQRTKSRVSR